MNFENNIDYQISVSITGDSEIAELNKKYRGKDSSTDVLSFELRKNISDKEFYIGDIVVNKDQAKRQCKKYGNTLEEEIAQLIEHGVLHLLGVHHEGDNH